jgi:hypothetical protein
MVNEFGGGGDGDAEKAHAVAIIAARSPFNDVSGN